VDKFSLDAHPPRRSPSPTPSVRSVQTVSAAAGSASPNSAEMSVVPAEASHPVTEAAWLCLGCKNKYHSTIIFQVKANIAIRNITLSAPKDKPENVWYDIGWSAEHQAMFRQKQLRSVTVLADLFGASCY
jgi:hypothetical protein